MNNEARNALQKHASEVAEHKYEPSDYSNSSQISSGTAETHEQFSDSYAAGTSDGIMVRPHSETNRK